MRLHYSERLAGIALFGFAGIAILAGIAAWSLGQPALAGHIWLVGTLPVLLSLVIGIAAGLFGGNVGLDIIALLSMSGALALGEALTAIVIALMVASGRVLERWAEARAQREMTALLSRVPRHAQRYEDGRLVQIPLDQVAAGDRLLVRAGDVVPVDGTVEQGRAVLDEAILTGEALPVTRVSGAAIRSGSVNAAHPFDMIASATAARSSLAGIVRLVEAARSTKAPSARLADRYALLFTSLSLGMAGLAWLVTADPVRALAVLVVATPCPLILGVPVAIVSGMSRCARRGILVKGGGVLETLARARTLFFDKTGTLTGGQPRLVGVEMAPDSGDQDLLWLAASLDQFSPHVIAEAVVTAARRRGLSLAVPEAVEETPGAGIKGQVDGRFAALGSPGFIADFAPPTVWSRQLLARVGQDGVTAVLVAVEGQIAGALLLADEIRPETPRALRLLRKVGLRRIVMLTGDRRDTAESVGLLLGVDTVLAELSPAEKLAALTAPGTEAPVIMVGDGVNDAPALAAADVGVAMGARGAAASSEAAGIVLMVDRLDRLAEGVTIARRARRIALESVLAGMGLSLAAMIVAALGFLPPLAGAILQEGIDVAVILNALRALQGPAPRGGRPGLSHAEVNRLAAEHTDLQPVADRIRLLADRLSTLAPQALAEELAALDTLLRERVLAHERQDETDLYPAVAAMLGGEDAMAPLSGMHREIHRLSGRVSRTATAAVASPDGVDVTELRRVLYGLDAVLRLHCAEEDAVYFNLEDAA
ncbi:MAG TPA: heavy metal translocating P-type ATPase [Acidisoma sp.]|uniref:heavy metal translocating P-type ATPase n=1 Tax=Acidisoma sp. TaxID=1872115 RepID=UPI002CF9E298|nr:heavy metal translocating P-type ATPase [Acidisoma sp.]HTI02966.1 heavy metal translocating P-type ATPase [Acidisoma sp.]